MLPETEVNKCFVISLKYRDIDDTKTSLSNLLHCNVIKTITKTSVFSLPELKATVNFSDRLSFVVSPYVRPSTCLSKLFTFSSSSPDPLDQFQTNLAQGNLGGRGFKFIEMKGHSISQGEVIGK